MKSVFILILLLLVFSVKAQDALIVPINADYDGIPPNAYYKDLDNELDGYVGEWKFSDSYREFTVVLQKKEMVSLAPLGGYSDFIVGEYRYIENGVQIINTIPLLASAANEVDNRNIIGSLLFSGPTLYVPCPDCGVNEKRLKLGFFDPQRPYVTTVSMFLRINPELTEPQQMTLTIKEMDSYMLPDDTAPLHHRVPYGTYLMEKQD